MTFFDPIFINFRNAAIASFAAALLLAMTPAASFAQSASELTAAPGLDSSDVASSDLSVIELAPKVVLYEPTDDGSLQLVGVEYFAAALANTAGACAP